MLHPWNSNPWPGSRDKRSHFDHGEKRQKFNLTANLIFASHSPQLVNKTNGKNNSSSLSVWIVINGMRLHSVKTSITVSIRLKMLSIRVWLGCTVCKFNV